MYYLVSHGIPDHLRVQVWKDLLRYQVNDFKNVKDFRKKYPHQYQQKLSLYENYKAYADKHDMVSFEQIDEDIG